MPVVKDVRIIKAPLGDRERCPDYPQAFPRLPRLYLELLENKAKIKQDLINKEYNPAPDLHEHIEQPVNRKRSRDSQTKVKHEERKESKSEKEIEENDESISVSKESNVSQHSYESDTDSPASADSIESNNTSSDDLSLRLKKLLDDDNITEPSRSPADKYSVPHKETIASRGSKYTPYDRYKNIHEERKADAPTLAELEAKGQIRQTAELRDINHVGRNEVEDEDKKRELLFKFDLLRKSYPLSQQVIPEHTIHSDLSEMYKSYDMTVKKLSLDSTVETYKQYLIHGFMITEFVFGHFLSFDMQGFTQQQLIDMNTYERLLVELGEKSYVPEGSKWPVELRLLFVILMNAGIFIVGKMILRKTGANVLSMSNAFRNPIPAPQTKPKHRMKGPTINPDTLPDVDEPEQKQSS